MTSLPLALGIALSPFPIIPSILLLFTARPRAAGAGFLLGWLAGVGAATSVAVMLTDLVDLGGPPPTWASWLRIGLGAVLVVLGGRQWLRRGATKESPRWMATVEQATPRRAVRLGFLLAAANPKILLLAVAGGLTIGSEQDGLPAQVLAVAAFTIVASATVAAPLLALLIGGDRVLAPLQRVRDWLEANNDSVMAVVLVVLGVLLALKGIDGL